MAKSHIERPIGIQAPITTNPGESNARAVRHEPGTGHPTHVEQGSTAGTTTAAPPSPTPAAPRRRRARTAPKKGAKRR